MPKSRIPSPSRSQGPPITPRRHKFRRTQSVGSPAKSDASGRLTSVVKALIDSERFAMSPMRSVLTDDTNIEAPRRASWWKRLEGSTRDILQALDANKMQDDLLLEEYEFEVPNKKQNQTVLESSDNESVSSIVVPHRNLFNRKKQPQERFADIMGSPKSLGKTHLEDQDNTITVLPKNLFNKGQPRSRPVFPAALLNFTNKTINKTVEPEPVNQRHKLFGQGTKRKNMFDDFVLSESEGESEIQHKVFGFNKKDSKRISLASRNKRMPSLTPSVTTEIDIDDWNLLPSSTMIGNGSGVLEVFSTSDKETEQAQVEDQDVTLTEANEIITINNKTIENKIKQSLGQTSFSKSRKQDDEFDKTLTKESIEIKQASKNQDNIEVIIGSGNINKSDSKIVLPENNYDKIFTKETSKIVHADIEKLNKNDTLKTLTDESIEIEQAGKNQDDIGVITGFGNINKSNSKIVLPENNSLDKKNTIVHADIEKLNKNVTLRQDSNNANINEQTTENKSPTIEDKMAELHGESGPKEKSDEGKEPSIEQENEISSKEISNENQDTDMEEMLWNDNDDKINEKAQISDGQNDKDDESEVDKNNENDERVVSDNVNPVEDIPGKNKIESMEDQLYQENDVVDEMPNSTYDMNGRNRKKDPTEVETIGADVENVTKENISFKPIGRSTSFRKSKSAIDDINLRPTLIPLQESSVGSDGSRNSSTEGSGWDSHRTTRKTLRQTFGKDFTPRKSLRALVMEKSAKRQTYVHETTSKNNTTKNRTVLEDARARRVSYRNLSSDHLSNLKSPVPGVSAHHVSDPLISEPQLSYHKSVHDINEPDISQKKTNREELFNMSDQINNDSGPEISMHASYGAGMSREVFNQENVDISVKEDRHRATDKKNTLKPAYLRIDTSHEMQEVLDYDPSIQEDSKLDSALQTCGSKASCQEITETETDEILEEWNIDELQHVLDDKEDSGSEEPLQEIEAEESEESEESEEEVEVNETELEVEDEESELEVEDEESEQEVEEEESEQEIEAEKSQQGIVANESEQEVEDIESEQEIEAEESQQGIEADESEQEAETNESEQEEDEESQQEIEAEEYRQGIEADESEQEAEDNESEQEEDEESQQEIEAEECQQGIKADEPEQVAEAKESEQEEEEESEQEIEAEKSQQGIVAEECQQGIEADESEQEAEVNESEQEEDEESESEDELEISISRMSEPAKEHNVSAGTKKSLLLAEMQKIAQENMEWRQKIRDKLQNSLKLQRDPHQFMSPIRNKLSIRRNKKPEPLFPKRKPRKTEALLMGTLPKEFVEDMKYKPPKRFKPANAPWITKRLYKFLETKLEPKYDYCARVRAEKLVQSIYEFTKVTRRRDVAPQTAVDELKKEMARLNVVTTHFDFYEFFHEFMPRGIRIKVNPDIVNKIPKPRNVFANILQLHPAVG